MEVKCVLNSVNSSYTQSRDNDPFNMISGTTGISGCVDGSMVMIEKQRGSGEVVLHCVGRDIENLKLHLRREGALWSSDEIIIPKPCDTFSSMIHDFMLEKNISRARLLSWFMN